MSDFDKECLTCGESGHWYTEHYPILKFALEVGDPKRYGGEV